MQCLSLGQNPSKSPISNLKYRRRALAVRAIGNESVPIQLAQCRFPGLVISNAKILIYFFQIKYTKAILLNSTQKLLWLEIAKMLIAVSEKKYCVIYCNFRLTFVPYAGYAAGKQ